jgi:hypothetical protein
MGRWCVHLRHISNTDQARHAPLWIAFDNHLNSGCACGDRASSPTRVPWLLHSYRSGIVLRVCHNQGKVVEVWSLAFCVNFASFGSLNDTGLLG